MRKRAALLFLLATALALAANAYVQFGTPELCCIDQDGYYHARYAQLLWQNMGRGVFPPPFTALPLTTWRAENFADHHLLFHVWLSPFVGWLGDVLGAKVGTGLLATVAVVACYALVLRYQLRYPFVWLLALLGSATLIRLNMTKAISLSVVLMAATIFLLFERKYKWLLPVGFAFAWAHHSWVLLGVMGLLWSMAVLLHNRSDWRNALVPLLFICAGLLLGQLINPYFPNNWTIFIDHVRMRMMPVAVQNVVVGIEWYPPTWQDFLLGAGLPSCLWMGFGLFCVWHTRKSVVGDTRTTFLFLLAVLFTSMTLNSQRFYEYLPLFAVLFAAFAAQPFLSDLRPMFYPTAAFRERHPLRPAKQDAVRIGTVISIGWRELAVLVLVLLSLRWSVENPINTVKKMRELQRPHASLAPATSWINANLSSADGVILNEPWDDFGQLYFYAPQFQFVTGLDPFLLIAANAERGATYQKLLRGEVAQPANVIAQQFGARHVLICQNTPLVQQLAATARRVYADDFCVIYDLTKL